MCQCVSWLNHANAKICQPNVVNTKIVMTKIPPPYNHFSIAHYFAVNLTVALCETESHPRLNESVRNISQTTVTTQWHSLFSY